MIGATHLPKPSKMVQASDMKERGLTYDEIGAALGISRDTAKNYANATTRGDAKNNHGNEPRCACGLLLPCACGGKGLHAVDFLGRNGEPAAVTWTPRSFRG